MKTAIAMLSILVLGMMTARAQTPPGATGFETAADGKIGEAAFDGFLWRSTSGLAQIRTDLAKTGKKCLHLAGGDETRLELTAGPELAGRPWNKLEFSAERWTSRDPFQFRVEARGQDGAWIGIYNGDAGVKTARGYPSQVAVPLPRGWTALRLACLAPQGGGVLLDDLRLVESKPMRVVEARLPLQVAPLLMGKDRNDLVNLEVVADGDLQPVRVTGVELEIEGADLLREVFAGKQSLAPAARMRVPMDQVLADGVNLVSIQAALQAGASIDARVRVVVKTVFGEGGQPLPLAAVRPVTRRIGVALRTMGQDGVNTYRIPGLAASKAGTLLAVYDARRRGGGDLPGDIDVALSRSTDGGQTWSPMKIIMDMGNDPTWSHDGIGDPCILADQVTGTVWVAATWSHGKRSWNGSGPGMTPEETGQVMLVRSDDDGLTWSAPVNITAMVKKPEWRFVLPSPGNGITMRDGTLVFPAQYRGENAPPVGGRPFSTIIYSRDRGKTWAIGTGMKVDTTESQVVQLADGTLMLNCRDNRGGSRSVYTTADLGRTWVEHPTSRKALPEPVCNAGLLRVEHPVHGALLFFSNPASTRRRDHMTLKVSRDEGLTWPENMHLLYDERYGLGYSSLAQVGPGHIGVLWEGKAELYYLRIPVDELVRGNTPPEAPGQPLPAAAGSASAPAASPRRDYTIPMLELASEPSVYTVVDREKGRYLGQPTTVLFKDGRTLLAAYPDGHGHGRLVLSRSGNAGDSWRRLDTGDARAPEVPTLYRLPLPDGRERVLLVTCHPAKGVLEWMWSDDRGDTWSPRRQWKPEGPRGAIVALASLWPAETGKWRGVYHDFNFDNWTVDLELAADTAAHGGLDCRFSNLRRMDFATPGGLQRSRAAGLCEAGVVPSPDGKRIALLFRPQHKKTNAMIAFSEDRGLTWSDPAELPGALSGERHTARYAPDGRLVVCFRDFSLLNRGNPSHGDWVAWIGSWDDLVAGREGQCRIRLRRNYGNSTNANIGDCGYTGLEVLPDGRILALTYGHWDLEPGSKHPGHPEGRGLSPYLLQARFRLEDVDRWLKDTRRLVRAAPAL